MELTQLYICNSFIILTLANTNEVLINVSEDGILSNNWKGTKSIRIHTIS